MARELDHTNPAGKIYVKCQFQTGRIFFAIITLDMTSKKEE